MISPTPQYQVKFLSNVQRLLDEGFFSASYKYALLLSLADIAVEKGISGADPVRVTSREIAVKFIEYYWPQSAPYPVIETRPQGDSLRPTIQITPVSDPERRSRPDMAAEQQAAYAMRGCRQPAPQPTPEGQVLLQNTGNQAEVIQVIQEVRGDFGGTMTLLREDRKRWHRLVSRVASVVNKMPLWKLQTLGREQVEFLYKNEGRGSEITLKEGVGYCLQRFHGLIYNLVTGAWIRFVRGLKKNMRILGEHADLAEFMFGSERMNLSPHREILQEIQKGLCFYCGSRIRGTPNVDHFIPWARYPTDLGNNFVLAHAKCNTKKADRLASFDHLIRWCERNEEQAETLRTAYDASGIIHDIRVSLCITRWAYGQVENQGGMVWQEADSMIPLDPRWKDLPGLGLPPKLAC